MLGLKSRCLIGWVEAKLNREVQIIPTHACHSLLVQPAELKTGTPVTPALVKNVGKTVFFVFESEAHTGQTHGQTDKQDV